MPHTAVADFLHETIRAEVTDPATGQPLWSELHEYDAASARKRVTYRSPEGEELGERVVVFAGSSGPLPSIRWTSTAGSRFDLRVDGRRAVISRSGAGPGERRLLPVPPRAAVDSGVEILIRRAWRTLVYGRPLRLELWRPETGRFFPYSLRRTGFGRWKGRPAVRFLLWPDRGEPAGRPAATRLTFDAYTRSPVRQEGPLVLPGIDLEVRSALLQVDLPLPGPLSRPDVDPED